MPTTQEVNRQNAIAFHDLMFNQCKPREAVERFVGATYTQHNPHLADGKEAFVAYFERMACEYPGKQVFFKRTVAEGKLVVLHCHQRWPTDPNPDWAGIDIFRFDHQGHQLRSVAATIIPSAAKPLRWQGRLSSNVRPHWSGVRIPVCRDSQSPELGTCSLARSVSCATMRKAFP